MARAFDHGVMRRNCIAFASGSIPNKLRPVFPTSTTVPPELRAIAKAFETLQEQRHAADYDVLRIYTRRDVLLLVSQVEQAVLGWSAIQGSETGQVFLLSLLIGDRIRD